MANVCLALSGGGLRATFFHFGVIAALREIGLLDQVTEIASVSGGSILAPHLVLNWQTYAYGNEEEVAQCYDELLWLSRRNIRNRVLLGSMLKYILVFPIVIRSVTPEPVRRLLKWVRRRLFGKRLGPALEFFDRCFNWDSGKWLAFEYSQSLFRRSETLANLKQQGPHLSILATSLTTGQIVAHCSDGFGFYEPLSHYLTFSDQVDYPLAKAVAASSAFPPAFSPVQLKASDIGLNDEQGLDHWLTDGGIHDNTGVVWLTRGSPRRRKPGGAIDLLIVSNAGRPFSHVWRGGPAALKRLWRNMRANEIAAGRLERHDLSPLPVAPHGSVTIGIEEKYPINFEDGALQPNRQLQVALTRTDLGGLDRDLLEMITRHGYILTKFKIDQALR